MKSKISELIKIQTCRLAKAICWLLLSAKYFLGTVSAQTVKAGHLMPVQQPRLLRDVFKRYKEDR